MKQIILCLLFISTSIAQNTYQDISVIRGDATTPTIRVAGNYTADSLSFVVKATSQQVSPRVVQKTTNAGLITTYKSPYSTITITLYTTDTGDLAGGIYYYDLLNITDSITISSGYFTVLNDIQTPYDGTNLPTDATRITTVSLGNGTLQNELVFWDTTLAKWKPSGVTTSNSGSVSDADSLGGVPASGYAKNSLNNLGTTSINTDLRSGSVMSSIGDGNIPWNSIYLWNGLYMKPPNSPYYTYLGYTPGAVHRNIYLPDASGTVALLSDIGTGGAGLFEADGNGDLMPNDAIVEDTYYELDGNGDIQPL